MTNSLGRKDNYRQFAFVVDTLAARSPQLLLCLHYAGCAVNCSLVISVSILFYSKNKKLKYQTLKTYLLPVLRG